MREIKIVEELPKDNWALDFIGLEYAHKFSKGKGVKIAVIDTGVFNHNDFSDNIKSTINMHTQTTNVEDDFGHGTHVAGLIVGDKTGVAPESDLYVAKVLDSNGLGDMRNVIDGITYAINTKVDILCVSLGIKGRLPSLLEERIIKAHEKGIIVVCATGNRGNKYPDYPAFYDFVIGVGGIDESGKLADFSSYGEQMDIVAPSTNILSTYLDGKYAYDTGTSMATPLVVGAIALLKSYYREKGIEININDVREMFESLSDKKTDEMGYGVLDFTKLFGNYFHIRD